MLELIKDKKFIVMLGTGGVGKTTCSIALAIMAARHGRKVGLLSIDPAKRLASALGLPLGHEPKEIIFETELEFAGSLKACMLDQKEIFDAMVRKFTKDPRTCQNILNNQIYKAISTKFGGATEYMALAKTQEMLESLDYDLVILDTPPDTQALDFLQRPNVLENFHENKVIPWLIKPFHIADKLGVTKLFNVSERLMGGVAKIAGLQALKMISEFLILVQNVINGFHLAGQQVSASLKAPATAFILVSSVTYSSKKSALLLSRNLSEMGFNLSGIIANKILPKALEQEINSNPENFSELAQLTDLFLQKRSAQLDLCQELAKEIEIFSHQMPKVFTIEEQPYSLFEKKGIFQFSYAFGT